MVVSIVGGHGQIALDLSRLLAADGIEVRSLIRNPDHSEEVREAGGQPIVCDFESSSDQEIDSAIEGSDVVVFAAGAGPGSGADRKESVDYGAAVRLIEAARRNGSPRYVMISAVRADPDFPGDEVFAVYQQAGLGHGPLAAGLAVLPLGIGLAARKPSLTLRALGREWLRVRLRRTWSAIGETSELRRALAQLNHLLRTEPALHELDFSPEGFEWIEANDAANSVISFLRKPRGGGAPVLVVCNFTPLPREDYRVGVPQGGWWQELFNSDAADYGGAGWGNWGGREAEASGAHGRSHALRLTLPPLATVMFKPTQAERPAFATRLEGDGLGH